MLERKHKPSPLRLHRVGLGASLMLIAMIYAFLLVPILLVVVNSFNAGELVTFPPSGLSMRWYKAFIENDSFVDAFRFSLWLAALSSLLATVIGFLAAYGIKRGLARRRELGQSLALLPVMVPHVLIGMSLLLALTIVPLPESVALVAGHVLIAVPFTIAAISASLEGVDVTLEQAALTLGASRWRAAWEVVVPLVSPGLLSALLFAFIVSFGDAYLALFLSAPGKTTLPIEVFTYLQWESTPVVAAITSAQIFMIVLLGLLIERLVGLKSILRIRD
jgi:putative spermidine/putrescine transport system permease protein